MRKFQSIIVRNERQFRAFTGLLRKNLIASYLILRVVWKRYKTALPKTSGPAQTPARRRP